MLTVASLPWFALLAVGLGAVAVVAVRMARSRHGILDQAAVGILVLAAGGIGVSFVVAVLAAILTPPGQL